MLTEWACDCMKSSDRGRLISREIIPPPLKTAKEAWLLSRSDLLVCEAVIDISPFVLLRMRVALFFP